MHWLDIYRIYETVPRLLSPPAGSPPGHCTGADCMSHAVLSIPVTIYRLLVCKVHFLKEDCALKQIKPIHVFPLEVIFFVAILHLTELREIL